MDKVPPNTATFWPTLFIGYKPVNRTPFKHFPFSKSSLKNSPHVLTKKQTKKTPQRLSFFEQIKEYLATDVSLTIISEPLNLLESREREEKERKKTSPNIDVISGRAHLLGKFAQINSSCGGGGCGSCLFVCRGERSSWSGAARVKKSVANYDMNYCRCCGRGSCLLQRLAFFLLLTQCPRVKCRKPMRPNITFLFSANLPPRSQV